MTQQPEPKPKLNLEEQMTDIVLKIIKTGGIAGGGIGAFWQLFKESDIPKAILSLVIGIAISYATILIQPIHKGTKKRLEDFGKEADRRIDILSEAVVARVLSMEERYFKAQAADCELYKTEGVGKIDGRVKGHLLEDVFVRLELNRNQRRAGWSGKNYRSNRGDNTLEDLTTDIWTLLLKGERDPLYKQIAILAWGGFGKTTLLRHVTYQLGRNKQSSEITRFVPVLLLLRKYRDLLGQEHPKDLSIIIEEHHIPNLITGEELRMPTDWAKNLLRQGKMLVMLDGFDEVPKLQRPLVARWLNMQMRRYPKTIFILTARPKAYIEQVVVDKDRLDLHSVLRVKPFDQEQRREFVEKWYQYKEQEYYGYTETETSAIRHEAEKSARDLLVQIEERQELTDFASNPLLLTMIARFHRRYPTVKLPRRRVELYEEICMLQLRDRPMARELGTVLTDCDSITILQMLALEMMQEKEISIDHETLLERIRKYLTEQEEIVGAEDFLKQVEEISELLVEREPNEFEFAHLSFQEFLAAMEVIRLKQENLLYRYFEDDRWKQVITMYVSKIRKPSDCIKAIRSAGVIDLAYECIQETNKRIDVDLKKDIEELKMLRDEAIRIKTSRYQQLDGYLKAREWEKAEWETDKLILSAVRKEMGESLEPNDLCNFPLDELLAIDRLWVEHSNGLYAYGSLIFERGEEIGLKLE
ncbi:MAG: NACHT domain-containing protein, partial [Pseudanabaena sp. ELA645]